MQALLVKVIVPRTRRRATMRFPHLKAINRRFRYCLQSSDSQDLKCQTPLTSQFSRKNSPLLTLTVGTCQRWILPSAWQTAAIEREPISRCDAYNARLALTLSRSYLQHLKDSTLVTRKTPGRASKRLSFLRAQTTKFLSSPAPSEPITDARFVNDQLNLRE